MKTVISDFLATLDTEGRFRFAERAAIMEIDGHLPRDQAEDLAMFILKEQIAKGLVPDGGLYV